MHTPVPRAWRGWLKRQAYGKLQAHENRYHGPWFCRLVIVISGKLYTDFTSTISGSCRRNGFTKAGKAGTQFSPNKMVEWSMNNTEHAGYLHSQARNYSVPVNINTFLRRDEKKKRENACSCKAALQPCPDMTSDPAVFSRTATFT